MFQTVIDLYDVFRTDLFVQAFPKRKQLFSTVPADYVSRSGFYI